MDPLSIKYLAVSILGIVLAFSAFSVSMIFTSAIKGISRNPESEQKISKYIYVGAGLCEAMGLFALVIMFILLFII